MYTTQGVLSMTGGEVCTMSSHYESHYVHNTRCPTHDWCTQVVLPMTGGEVCTMCTRCFLPMTGEKCALCAQHKVSYLVLEAFCSASLSSRPASAHRLFLNNLISKICAHTHNTHIQCRLIKEHCLLQIQAAWSNCTKMQTFCL